MTASGSFPGPPAPGSSPSSATAACRWSCTRRGAAIRVFDPVATAQAKQALPKSKRLTFAKDPYDALRGASALLLVTEWDEFRQPDFRRVKNLLKKPVIVDGRNIYNPKDLRKLGFKYASIGRT